MKSVTHIFPSLTSVGRALGLTILMVICSTLASAQNILHKREFSKAMKGDKEALFNVAVNYFYARHGYPLDEEQAVMIFKTLDTPEANYYLGLAYEAGEGVDADTLKAIECYKKSSTDDALYSLSSLYEDLGDYTNMYNTLKNCRSALCLNALGLMCLYGLEVETDDDMAAFYFRESIKLEDNQWARYNLGKMLMSNYYEHADAKEAIVHLKKASELGHSNAMAYVGYMYENGMGVNADMDEAFKWYKKAADNDNDDALLQLGYCYYNGRGCKENGKKAMECFLRSAKQDNSFAYMALANYYTYGIYVKPDYKMAISCIDKAIEIDPSEPAFLDCRGEILLKDGDEAGALEMYRQVKHTSPGYYSNYISSLDEHFEFNDEF